MLGQSKPISFPYDHKKATQAVLWLLHRHGGSMDKLKLVKLAFLADRKHFIQYGRPIIGGCYFAMNLGPVSSELKDHIDEACTSAELPFVIQGRFNLVAKEPTDEDCLSESGLEILDAVYDKYRYVDSVKLGLMTHELKAWKKNQPQQGGRKSIPYEDFFEDSEDNSILELVREDQEARDFLET